MHSLATRVHVNTPSRWAEAHKGANSARRIFLGLLGILESELRMRLAQEAKVPGGRPGKSCSASLVCCVSPCPNRKARQGKIFIKSQRFEATRSAPHSKHFHML